MVKVWMVLAMLFAGNAWGVTASVIATNNGAVYTSNGDYATGRNLTSGGTTDTATLRIGQSTGYTCRRGFCTFAIPTAATITAVSLFLYGKTDVSTTDFELYVLVSTYSATLTDTDFPLFAGWAASGTYTGTVLNNTWSSASYSATWNELVFNAAGLAAVLAANSGTLKLAVISKEDYASSAPTNDEYINFETSGTVGKEPYLAITYTLPSGASRTILSSNGVATPLKSNGTSSPLK